MNHDRRMSRRGWIRGAAAGGLALSLAGRLPQAMARDGGHPAAGRIGDFRLSLAEWSLHKRYFASGNVSKANLGFPKDAKEEFGIEAVEYVNQFFKDKATDSEYLAELKKRAGDLGVTNVLIMIDGEGDLSAPEKSERDQAVDKHKRWVDAAKSLGCHAIRVNTGEHYAPGKVDDAAEACGRLAEYGKSQNIHVICENHGGPSSWPDALIDLIKAVNSPYFGTLPDFGNFPPHSRAAEGGPKEVDPYDAIARMMPYAKGVSAKSYDFGPDGKESHLDFARILKIVTDAGYHGHVGIEYEGSTLGEAEGIKATKALLEALRGAEYKPA
jgi:sugar phosphate isomerase/epimerase